MKKIILFGALSIAAILTSCASKSGASNTEKAEKPAAMNSKYEFVMPEDVLSGAAGFDEEEAKTKYNFSTAEYVKLASDANKTYLLDNGLYTKVQYEDGTGDYTTDILSKYTQLIDAGDGDKILELKWPMNKHYGFFINFSEQGANQKSIKNAVVKIRFYIPAEYCDPALGDNQPHFRFEVYDPNWAIQVFKGDLDKITFGELGAGWHTLTVDCGKGTISYDDKTAAFTAALPRKANAFCLQMNGSKLSANIPVYVDWISLEGL